MLMTTPDSSLPPVAIGPYQVRLAGPGDAPGLRQLFAGVPLPGAISLAFERHDPWAQAQLQCEAPQVWLATRPGDGRLVASYACGQRLVYVNGRPRRIPYLSDLRIAPEARSGLLLAGGFKHLRQSTLMPPAYAQTLILRQNHHAMQLLTSRRASLPSYLATGDYDHFALAAQSGRVPADQGLRAATPADFNAMQALYEEVAPQYQFRPVYRFDQLGQPYFDGLKIGDFLCAWRGPQLLGFAALWDLSHLRQTRVHAYQQLPAPAV
jgi:hypothetical protein